MKIKTLIIACMGLLIVCSAHAEVYVSGGVGVAKNTGSTTKNAFKGNYNTSAIYSGAFGYETDIPLVNMVARVRAEGEYLHNRAKIKKGMGYINMNALMANGYVDIELPLLPLITPYVGAGLGYGRLENDNVMPFQFMFGLDGQIFLIPAVASLEYRYLQSNRSSKSANERNKFYDHILMAKIRFQF